MLSPDLFHRLRAAQRRSVREQEILSGRNWILICALAHLLAAVYPAFLLFTVIWLDAPSPSQQLHPGLTLASTVFTGIVLLGFWWWARYAPYRGALAALVVYLIIQGVIATLDPRQLLVGATLKALIILGLVQAVRTGFRRHRPQ